MEPCKHGHHDGALHIPCPHCRVEYLEGQIDELRATITRYEAQMLRMAQCAGEFAKDATPSPIPPKNTREAIRAWDSMDDVGRAAPVPQQAAGDAPTDAQIDAIMATTMPRTRPSASFRNFARAVLAAHKS